jgi:hypothetical protein
MDAIIRTKWIKMIDADKCQFNGYNDFFVKESEKIKRAELEREKDQKDTARIRAR